MTTQPGGQILSERYELERELRTDAFGKTWRALDLKQGGKVDIRLVPHGLTPTTAHERLEVARAVKHPGIVATLDFVTEGELAGFVLEANDGETMQQRRARRPRRHFDLSEIKPWLRSIVEALACLHEQGHPHGALYIGSFLVEGADLKLTDVAVAPLLHPQAASDGRAALPAAAMSPQVLEAQPPSVADDIYALGALIYDLLTSQPVFSSGDIHTQVKRVRPPTIHDRRAQLEIASAPLPPPWEEWIAAALAKDATRRPSLDDLSLLLKSGLYAGNTSPGTSPAPMVVASAVHQDEPLQAAPVHPAKARLPLNLLILGGSVLAATALIAGIYLWKMKPRQEFKAALDAAYQKAQNFDDVSPARHEDVIQRWQQFESEWQPRVEAEQPDLKPLLVNAGQKRHAREVMKGKEEERVRLENQQKRKAYVNAARAALDITRARAGAASTPREEALAAWRQFITKYDVDYQGGRPDEITRLIAEAKTAQQTLEKAATDEKKEHDGFIAQRVADMTLINDPQMNITVPTAEKIKRVEDFLASCAGAPLDVAADPSFITLKSAAETKLESLRAAAATETPAAPLDLDGLFASSACKDFSKEGKQRLLKKTQETLKTTAQFEGECDGQPGKPTHEAILAFQNANHLVPSAALDDATLAKIDIGELVDDATPMPAAAPVAAKAHHSSKSKAAPKEEKSTLGKGADVVKKGFNAVKGFFSK
ncbi:MAG: putative peptidoglycan binding protein [Verrucomicrobiaceae bacterium]|nr:putative peptidoglycan binding protein [Verrucomicrobiaceae bacterium]